MSFNSWCQIQHRTPRPWLLFPNRKGVDHPRSWGQCGPISTRRTTISWRLIGRMEAVLPLTATALQSVLRSPVTSQQPPWYQTSQTICRTSSHLQLQPGEDDCTEKSTTLHQVLRVFCLLDLRLSGSLRRMFLHDVLGPWRVYSECLSQKVSNWNIFISIQSVQSNMRAELARPSPSRGSCCSPPRLSCRTTRTAGPSWRSQPCSGWIWSAGKVR